MVVKGRNRDTAWFAITDEEWPRIRAGMERWLEPANFDATAGRNLAAGDAAERLSRSEHVGEKPVEVFYNSACPVCDAGVKDQRRAMEKAGAGDLAWTDMTCAPDALQADGLTLDHVRRLDALRRRSLAASAAPRRRTPTPLIATIVAGIVLAFIFGALANRLQHLAARRLPRRRRRHRPGHAGLRRRPVARPASSPRSASSC